MRTMLLAAVFLVLPALATAEPLPDATKMVGDDCARARKLNKTCVLSIEDEQIEGTKVTAGESPIVVSAFASHRSLVRVRADFIPEILKSAEDL